MSGQFLCLECGKRFAYNKNLRQHVAKAHPGKLNDLAPLIRSQRTYAFKCHSCNKNFSREKNLRQHQRNHHGEAVDPMRSLKCCLCNLELSTEKCFTKHLEQAHETQLKCEELDFLSFDDFQSWKHETEKSTHSIYIKNCGSKVGPDKSVRHYYTCHRSGNFTSRGKGIRQLKGSMKISGLCPARIRVRQAEDGTCLVKYISTHIGHKNDPSHVDLSEKRRTDNWKYRKQNSISSSCGENCKDTCILAKLCVKH